MTEEKELTALPNSFSKPYQIYLIVYDCYPSYRLSPTLPGSDKPSLIPNHKRRFGSAEVPTIKGGNDTFNFVISYIPATDTTHTLVLKMGIKTGTGVEHTHFNLGGRGTDIVVAAGEIRFKDDAIEALNDESGANHIKFSEMTIEEIPVYIDSIRRAIQAVGLPVERHVFTRDTASLSTLQYSLSTPTPSRLIPGHIGPAATPEQKESLRRLIQSTPPRSSSPRRPVSPKKLASSEGVTSEHSPDKRIFSSLAASPSRTVKVDAAVAAPTKCGKYGSLFYHVVVPAVGIITAAAAVGYGIYLGAGSE